MGAFGTQYNDFVVYCLDFGKFQPSRAEPQSPFDGGDLPGVPLVKSQTPFSLSFYDANSGTPTNPLSKYDTIYNKKTDVDNNPNPNPDYQVYIGQNSLRNLGVFMNGYPSRVDIGETFGLTKAEMEWCTNIALKITRSIDFKKTALPQSFDVEYDNGLKSYSVNYIANTIIPGLKYSEIKKSTSA